MTSPKQLAALLAQADISEDERQGWAKMIPLMSDEQREDLAASLRKQNQQLAALRLDYTKKLRTLVDDQQMEDAKGALQS